MDRHTRTLDRVQHLQEILPSARHLLWEAEKEKRVELRVSLAIVENNGGDLVDDQHVKDLPYIERKCVVEAVMNAFEGGGREMAIATREAIVLQLEDPKLWAEREDLVREVDGVVLGSSIAVEGEMLEVGSDGHEEERRLGKRRRVRVDLGREAEGEASEEREVSLILREEGRERKVVSVSEVVASDLEGTKRWREDEVAARRVSPPKTQLLERVEEGRRHKS